MERNVIEVPDLGLAAFMKMNNAILVKSEKIDMFNFLCSDGEDISNWELQYANSCCKRHDWEVRELRRMKNMKFTK